MKSFLMQPTYVIECTFPVNNNARKNIFVVCSRKLHTRLHLWYCKMMKQFARAERNCRNALLQIQSCREALHMTKCYLPYQNDSILRIFWFSQKITFSDFSSSKIKKCNDSILSKIIHCVRFAKTWLGCIAKPFYSTWAIFIHKCE